MVDDVMFSSKYTEWETPPMLYDYLNKYFGPFTLDAAASFTNTKCAEFFNKDRDGLKHSWKGYSVYVNPPYGRKLTGIWVEKAFNEVWNDDSGSTKVVMLLPSRTGTSWFHKYLLHAEQIYFIEGRLHFFEHGVECKDPAPFDSMIIVLNSATIKSQLPAWGVINGKMFRPVKGHKKKVKSDGVLSVQKTDSDEVLVQ